MLADLGWGAAFVGSAIVTMLVGFVYHLCVKETPSDIGLPEYIDENSKREEKD